MAGFAHDRAAARKSPDAIVAGMRSAVRFVADQPQDLAAALLQDIALLLHGRRIDPSFSVADPLSAVSGGFEDAAAACHRLPQHDFLGEAVTAKFGALLTGRSVITGKRLFDDDVLAAIQGFDRHRFMA